MKKILSAIIASVALTGCSEYLFYQQGPSIPEVPGWNDYNTTWVINGQTVGKYAPAGHVVNEPGGWNCKYSATINTTSNYTFKWITCKQFNKTIKYALTCKLEEPDYNEFQINIHNDDDYINASCETSL